MQVRHREATAGRDQADTGQLVAARSARVGSKHLHALAPRPRGPRGLLHRALDGPARLEDGVQHREAAGLDHDLRRGAPGRCVAPPLRRVGEGAEPHPVATRSQADLEPALLVGSVEVVPGRRRRRVDALDLERAETRRARSRRDGAGDALGGARGRAGGRHQDAEQRQEDRQGEREPACGGGVHGLRSREERGHGIVGERGCPRGRTGATGRGSARRRPVRASARE